MYKNQFLRRLVFVAVLFFVYFPLNAAQGVLWGAEDIRVVKTQWFDIIYPPESEQSAAILSEKADDIYYEIAGLYGHEPQVRMPVVLSPYVEECNAYFTNGPYNRIVIYDTAVIDDLAVFSEDLLSLFRHELTHAYTFNLKNGFWKFIGNVFGDPVGPSLFTVSSGLAEGATMTSEASSGEGRLNSEFSMHIVKQAKLEKEFPEYDDVQGGSTVFPYGSFYYFNGAFNQWLQKKYGYEKYSYWRYLLVNGANFPSGAFKKAFGIELNKAWKQFEYDLYVPSIDDNPLNTGYVTDFFTGTDQFSSKNLAGPLYQSLSASKEGTLWIEKKQNGVFYNGKKIFSRLNVDTAKLSADGRIIAVTYFDTKAPAVLRKVKLYDTQTKKTINVEGSGYADATVICKRNMYYLVSMGFSSSKKWIDVKELEFTENGKKINVRNKQKIDMALNTTPSYFVDLDNYKGGMAYVKKEGLNYYIIVTEVGKSEIQEYKLPYEKMVIRDLSLSVGSNELLFSWTKPGTMPRLGKLNLDTEEFTFYKEDISGGIFNPVRQNDGKILYSGHFYRSYRLLVLDESKLTVELNSSAEKTEYYYVLPDKKVETARALAKSKPYSSFDYFQGMFIPLSGINVNPLDPIFEADEKTVAAPFGLTFQGTDPWGGLSYSLTSGFSSLTGLGGVRVGLSGGTDTSLFKWQAGGQVDFDYLNGTCKQMYADCAGSILVPFGQYSRVGMSEAVLAGLVRRSSLTLLESNTDVFYSCGHYSGPGTLEYSGFSAGCRVKLGHYFYNLEETGIYYEIGVSPYLNVFIPKLLPLNCREGFVYNLPLQLSFSLFDYNAFATGNADIVLFRQDVQKALPVVNFLFLQNYYIRTGYITSLYLEESGNVLMNDYLYLSGNVYISLSSASSGVTLYTDVMFSYRDLQAGRQCISITPGIKTHF